MSNEPLSVYAALTIAWMDGYHKRDAEIERWRERISKITQQRDGLLTGLDQKDGDIERLRGLLREAVAIIDGISPDTLGGWAQRVREALGE